MKYIITYTIVSTIFETIYLIISIKKGLKKFKQKPEYEYLKAFIQQLFLSAPMKRAKEMFWNWYTIPFVLTPIFIFVCQFLFPLSLFGLIKKSLGIKTKLQKESEAEEKSIEESKKKHDEWMKTEGDMNPIIEEPNFDEEIK